MSWFRRNPFGPIRVPAGKAGDAIIDMLCRVHGVSREEALERGRKEMKTVIRHGPVIPKPMKAPVGALFMMGDEEGIEKAKAESEDKHTQNCLRLAMGAFDWESSEDCARETAIRHYFATRHVLELASAWVERAAQIAPELQDEHLKDVRWAIRTVLDDADKDYRDCEKRMGKK